MNGHGQKLELGPLVTELRERNSELETAGAWPSASWRLLRDRDILKWFIPEEYGGRPVDGATRQEGYLSLASGCLTTAFILTQRNAAVARILLSPNIPLKQDLLTRLADDEIFATVGISHLTTSRQYLKTPTVQALPTDGGWTLVGEVPWVTGASEADVIVTGGVQPDGLQVLLALDPQTPGVAVQTPPRLLALNESMTSTVKLDDVFVPEDRLLLGPDERVLKAGGAGGLTTSALALGAALKSILGIEREAEKRLDLNPTASSLHDTFDSLQARFLELARREEPPTADELESLRKQSNSLVLNAAQAYLAASKGAGFLAGHPASRAVREAQFFLVWSCPQAVVNAALQAFACAT